VVAGGLVERLWRSLSGTAKSLPVRVLASAIAALLVFTNYTADACHPDGLYALHAMLLIALTADAIESGDQRRAMVVLALAGAGVLVKQTAVFGLAGAALSMLWFCGRRWGTERSALLALWGLACVAGASGIVLHGWGSYWAFELISREPVQWFRLRELAAQYTAVPYRLLLVLAFAPSAIFLALRTGPEAHLRPTLVAWLAVGITEVLPGLGSYLKIWGFWNTQGRAMGHPEDEAIRPWFYTWSLMSRLFPKGSRVAAVHETDFPAGLRTVAASDKEGVTVMVVNDADERRTVSVRTAELSGKKLTQYNYFASDRSVDQDGFPVPRKKKVKVDGKGMVRVDLPSRGVVFLRAS